MPGTTEITAQLLAIYNNLVTTIVNAVPGILTGLAIIVAMLVVAKLVEKILRAVLVRIRFDALLEQSGVDKTLHRIGLRQSLNHAIPRLVYFLLLVLFARTAADVLGLQAISEAFASFFAYLPNIVAAVLLIIVGTAASGFAGEVVTRAAEEAGIDFGRSLGAVVSALILFIVGVMAITQLQVDTEMVRLVTSYALAGGAIAFGLSFGLGSREVTRNILAGFYVRKVFRVGETIEVGGQSGTLLGITPTQTVIQSGRAEVVIANAVLLDEAVRQEPGADADA